MQIRSTYMIKRDAFHTGDLLLLRHYHQPFLFKRQIVLKTEKLQALVYFFTHRQARCTERCKENNFTQIRQTVSTRPFSLGKVCDAWEKDRLCEGGAYTPTFELPGMQTEDPL